MIVFVVGLFRKAENHQLKTHLVSHICYDAESADDAKRDFLVLDQCLSVLNDGYSLELIHIQQADITRIVSACKEAAQATLDVLCETVTKEAEQEGAG